MLKRISALLAALFLCAVLSGCSFVMFDAQALMSPPKSNIDQQSIHKLLQGSRQDITFIYPKSGEYRSAIIMRDFTGDGREDAIGFCALEDDSVEVQFLVKSEEDVWKTVFTARNPATQVDRVCFGDLNGDGRSDVLIGWGSTSGVTGRTAQVCAYLYDDAGDITEYTLGSYGEMTVTDFDDDGVDELFTADKYVVPTEEGGEALPAKGRVYAYRDGAIQEIFSADADNSITSYSAVTFGRLYPELSGIVLDGVKADGSMTTQIFVIDPVRGRLVNLPSGVNSETYQNPFSRPAAAPFLSRDINGDGVVEIPVTTLLPGIADSVTPDFTSFLVAWSVYDEKDGARSVLSALMNPVENYWFELPYGLKGKISASNDVAKRTVTYTEVIPGKDGEMPLLGAPLFSIRVFTQSAWDSRGQTSGYELLALQSDLVYGIQVLTSDAKYSYAIDRVKQNFRLISE